MHPTMLKGAYELRKRDGDDPSDRYNWIKLWTCPKSTRRRRHPYRLRVFNPSTTSVMSIE